MSFVCQAADGPVAAKAPIGERLRMLAVFSLPVNAGALSLRRERYQLTRLIQEIGAVNGKAIELRVLQYGVTVNWLATSAPSLRIWRASTVTRPCPARSPSCAGSWTKPTGSTSPS